MYTFFLSIFQIQFNLNLKLGWELTGKIKLNLLCHFESEYNNVWQVHFTIYPQYFNSRTWNTVHICMYFLKSNSFQQYFGSMNAEPVMDLLWSNGRRDSMNFVNHTLNSYVRMPYTNNWRIPSMRVHHDCSRCTIPASSGQRGIEISDR